MIIDDNLANFFTETDNVGFHYNSLCETVLMSTHHIVLNEEVQLSSYTPFEPPHGKTNNLHRRKQRRKSASR